MSFRLHKISFDEKNNTDFNFSTDKMDKNIIFSILIGANGTGKSMSLVKLIDIFRDIMSEQNKHSSKRKRLNYYHIIYELDGKVFNIKKNKETYTLGEGTSWKNILVPQSILALTFLAEDKFTYQSHEDNENSVYKYLGIRSAANAIFSGSVNKKIRSILFDCVVEKSFRDKVVQTFELLGYEPIVKMKFDYILKSMVTKKITMRTINMRMNTIHKKSKYANKNISLLTEQEKSDMLKYIQEVKNERSKTNTSKVFTELVIDFRETEASYKKYKIVKNMIFAGLLDPSTIEISQKDSEVDSESLSSGEKNLLYITLHILANVQNNSIIVIDEPEISLHPNWQIKYNFHLKQILSGYKNIHVIIATHSHFMVSGLHKDETNIFTIHKDKSVENIKDDTFSWSAENILYRIFNTRTVNNYYLEKDLQTVFSLISKNDPTDKKKIMKSYENIKDVVFHEDDPLYKLSEKIKKYLQEN
ncbi:MAG TPA: AAA family ATPase [Sulfurovum sp.]|uniref:AAA family ATPase n=1 Tax=Sulfurovum sp. TaxID=1969726 RepID=UPI002F94924E